MYRIPQHSFTCCDTKNIKRGQGGGSTVEPSVTRLPKIMGDGGSYRCGRGGGGRCEAATVPAVTAGPYWYQWAKNRRE